MSDAEHVPTDRWWWRILAPRGEGDPLVVEVACPYCPGSHFHEVPDVRDLCRAERPWATT